MESWMAANPALVLAGGLVGLAIAGLICIGYAVHHTRKVNKS